jgi:hypothetical protein
VQAGPLVSLIVTEPSGGRQQKIDIANAALTRAQNDATAALEALGAVAASVEKQISGALQTVGKPAGVDTDTLLARRADVQDLLTAQAGAAAQVMASSAPGGIAAVQSSAVAKAAGDFLRESLTRGDATGALDAYIVTNTLDLWFRARGADAAQLGAAFAEVIGQVQPGGTPPGVAVRVLLNGGPGTLKGYVSMAKIIVANEMDAARAVLAKSPAITDNSWAPYRGPK